MNDYSASLQQTTPATSLEDIDNTLQPTPLETAAQLDAFYRPEINKVRGGDKMQRLQIVLNQMYRKKLFFTACVMGHRGVGKSTELSRLINQVANQFSTIRFSAMTALDPGNFKPLDVLLLMIVEVTERTAEPIDKGGAGKPPSDARLREIWDWFATEKDTREQTRTMAASIEAGAGTKEDSLWGKVLGLFANLKGEMKFAATRKTEVVDYRTSRLTSLIEIANRLLDECNRLLQDATGRQWLFVGEDFDRAGIPSTLIEDLFITYANIFQDLRTHLIFTLPIGLYYSSNAARLPFPSDRSYVISDTPMYRIDHTPHENGRNAVEAVLRTRMDLNLFEPNQLLRVIVASGGNLSNVFSLVNYAAISALIRSATQINEADVTGAIVNLRSDYERRLGQSPFDLEEVTYSDKADLLKRIYNGEKAAQMTNPVLYSLLNARAVQEFNGQRWFGVHPLVVDILTAQNQLIPDSAGAILGGSF